MSEAYGTVVDAASVRFERLLPGPIGRVWDYLTQSELRGKWLAPGEMDLKPGGKVALHFHKVDLVPGNDPTPEEYRVGHDLSGQVTRCEPPRLLAFTWGKDSEVTFELAERGSKVLLTLTHAKLPGRDMMLNVSGGWHAHLALLGERLEGATPTPFWPHLEKLRAVYAQRL